MTPARGMTALYNNRTFDLHFKTVTVIKLLKMRRAAAPYGPDLRTLCISMGSFTDGSRGELRSSTAYCACQSERDLLVIEHTCMIKG